MSARGTRNGFRLAAAALQAAVLQVAIAAPASARDGEATGGAEPQVSRTEAAAIQEAAELAKTDRAAAIEKLRAARGEGASAAIDFALAVFLAQERRTEEAEEAYAAATRKSPSFVRAWTGLGRVRLVLGRHSGAAEALREAVRHGGGSAEVWKLLGYSYLLSDRLVAAETAYRQALVLAPDDRDVMLGMARTLVSAERPAEAIGLLRRLAATAPLEADPWLLLANAHLATDGQDRALEALECAHRLGVITAEGRMTLADLYYNKGLLDSAVRHYDLGIEGKGVTAERMLRCAEALHAAGRSKDASRYLAMAKARGLASPARGHLLAARIAEGRADLKGAREAYEAALEADPVNGEALVALGELHWRTKDYERASIVLERASRVRGFEASALVTLAQMEVELDRFDQAVAHLEAAQEARPSSRVGRYLDQVRRLARSVGQP